MLTGLAADPDWCPWSTVPLRQQPMMPVFRTELLGSPPENRGKQTDLNVNLRTGVPASQDFDDSFTFR